MNSCRSRSESRVGCGRTLLSHSSRAISRAGGKGAEKEGLKKVKEGISLLSIPSPTPPPAPRAPLPSFAAAQPAPSTSASTKFSVFGPIFHSNVACKFLAS